MAFKKFDYHLNNDIVKTYIDINKDLWKQYEKGIIDREIVIYKRTLISKVATMQLLRLVGITLIP